MITSAKQPLLPKATHQQATNDYLPLPGGESNDQKAVDEFVAVVVQPVAHPGGKNDTTPYMLMPNDSAAEKAAQSKSVDNAMAVQELEAIINEVNKINDLITEDLRVLVRPYLGFYDFSKPKDKVTGYPYVDLLEEACKPKDEKTPALMNKTVVRGQAVCWFNAGVDQSAIKAFMGEHHAVMQFGLVPGRNFSRAAEILIGLLKPTTQDKLTYNRGLRFFGFEDSPAGLLDLYVKKVKEMLVLKNSLAGFTDQAMRAKVAAETIAFDKLCAYFKKLLPVAVNNFRFYERASQFEVPVEKRANHQPYLPTLQRLMQSYANFLDRDQQPVVVQVQAKLK